MMRKLILAFLLCGFCLSQACINHKGQSVSWLLVINTPGSVSKGYLYFDSTFTTDKFLYYADKSDSAGNPLYNTLSTFNNKNIKLLAWNDQAPNGSASSTKAHSKSVIAFDSATNNGVVIVHSMP